MNGLRTPIEDFRLENGTYVGANAEPEIASFLTDINSGSYTFDVVSATSNSYDVAGRVQRGHLGALREPHEQML